MKNLGMETQRRWALLDGPNDLPVIFATKQDAVTSRVGDEYLVRVTIEPVLKKRRAARKETA